MNRIAPDRIKNPPKMPLTIPPILPAVILPGALDEGVAEVIVRVTRVGEPDEVEVAVGEVFV